jgi:hypothetical protein
MLDDGKFYLPVTLRATEVAQGRRAPLRRWTPIGPEQFVGMDERRPYTGDRSPFVKLDGAEARGVRQAGLVVRRRKTYRGRVVPADDPGAKVTVALAWGEKADERQTAVVKTPTN